MSLVAGTIPNLISGVSQQPAPSRLVTSAEEIINGFPSLVSGLMKRPPTEYVASLNASVSTGDTSAVHMIDRDAFEKYILVCGSQDLVLYDTNGVQQTVTFPDGKSYLPSSDMWRKLRFVTVADTTFILNTDVVTQSQSLTETRTNPSTQATIFVRQAVASVAYAVYVNGSLAATFSTDSNVSADTALEGTAEIAASLAADARARGYTDATNIGSTVIFTITAGQTLSVDDQFGGKAMEVYTDTVQTFEDLPPTEREGRLVKIAGDFDSDSSSFWVEFQNGVWVETVGYNARRGFNAATLPHILVKTGPSTFEFRRNVWDEREVGDEDSNPDPTFIGSTINGIFLFKGRFGFLSEENVVLSSVGSFETLYLTTVVQQLSSDVIDVASATGRVSTLYHAAAFSDELILFSDKQQFRLSSGTVLSAETVGISNSTAYPCSRFVAPVTVGASAFFTADSVTHSLAREVFIDSDRQNVNGEDIAVQLPAYIPKNIRTQAASPASDIMVILSENEPSSLYIYKWYISERRKIQSAWCKWEIDPAANIVGLGFLDKSLYLIYKVGNECRMDRMDVSSVIDTELLLDSQLSSAQITNRSYNAGTDVTTVVLPYSHPSTLEFYRTTGAVIEPLTGVSKVNDTTYLIPGDATGATLTAGLKYNFKYVFSEQYVRQEKSSGESAIQDGRLQLRDFSVIYTDSSYFEATVAIPGSDPSTYVFNGRVLGSVDNLLNTIPRETGEFLFPVYANSNDVTITLTSDKPYRAAFSSVEWFAFFRPKAKRV